MRTFVTGDLHGQTDARFSRSNMERLGVSDGDLLVVLGDMGALWNTTADDIREGYMDWADAGFLSALSRVWPGAVAFIDGNHENHATLAAVPVERRFGGRVGVVCEGVYHLLRGGVYDLPAGDGTARAWCMGGAWSIDRDWRVEGVSWWPEEIPSDGEITAARESMAFVGWKSDYILTHECPTSMRPALTRDSPFGPVKHTDRLQSFLDEVDAKAAFSRWYCGHYHVDRDVGGAHTCLYTQIVPLGAKAGKY